MSAQLPVACDMRALSERERKAQMAASIRLIADDFKRMAGGDAGKSCGCK